MNDRDERVVHMQKDNKDRIQEKNESGNLPDEMIRVTAADGMIRAFAARSTDMVREAQRIHGTSPNVTAALGRLLTGGVMMGAMMKDEEDRITITIRSDGPMKGLTVTADNQGHAKGYPTVAAVPLVEKYPGKLDVGASVGNGNLTVIRDEGLKEPYSSQVALVSGEIAEDLTYYFARSEQVPSAVGLGVLIDPDGSVRDAGGFIVQLMPGAGDEETDRLEAALKALPPVTSLLDAGESPEDILRRILGDQDMEFLDRMPVSFYCGCSRERVSEALLSIGEKEINEMIQEGEPVDLSCSFCGKKYTFTTEELKELLTASRPSSDPSDQTP